MSSRQHAPLILIEGDQTSRPLQPVSLQAGKSLGGYDEAWIRDLILDHPAAVPIQEIDASFGPLVPVCKELDTRIAGFADALFINQLGMPTLVECKLWRNPEARREVVGQILDYARVLRRWTFTDLQREAARARREQGFDLFEHVRQSHPDLDQAAFVDNVSRSLAQGRILLLVLGDGIREGVEAIAEYIQDHAGLHFTFGLVEAQVFEVGDGRRIVQPRVLARTLIMNRTVIDLVRPEIAIMEADETDSSDDDEPTRPDLNERQKWMKGFWTDLLSSLKLDDADQPLANPLTRNNIFFPLPAKNSMWLTCYFYGKNSEIGIFLGMSRTSPVAMEIANRLEADKERVTEQFGELPVAWSRNADGKLFILASKCYPDLRDPSVREDQLAWFRTAINAFVNVLRPRIAVLYRELADSSRTAAE